MSHPARRLIAGATLALAASGLVACGQSSSQDSGSGSAKAEAGALPVTIQHKFGKTTIKKAPERVVVVGLIEQDALLALGVNPVADTEWFGKAPGQIFPWAQDALGEQKPPTVLQATNGVNMDKIAAQRPDLIIGQYAGLKKKEYQQLSQLAPTVAQPGEYVDYAAPWDEGTETVAKAIGKPAAGAKLVQRVKGRVKQEAKKNQAAFEAKKAIVLSAYDGIYVFGPQDPRARLLDSLGLEFPEKLKKKNAKEFGWSVSPERIRDLADVDVVVWMSKKSEVDKATGGGWAKTKAAKEGRAIYINSDNGPYEIGSSMLTPLSIPWVLDRYVPQLTAALDGDPSTKVPSPKR